MAKFRVDRYRTGYASDSVEVDARNEAEAVQIADNKDFDSSEHDADYKYEATLISGEPESPEPAWYIKSRPLEKPLTEEQVKELQDEEGYIDVIVALELNDIIKYNLEGFLDLLEENILQHGVLSDITYRLLGAEGGMINIGVKGAVED